MPFPRALQTASIACVGFMTRQRDINEKMRAILIDWLVELQLKFKLMVETLYLTVNLIDRYLEKSSITRNKLQLVGVTAIERVPPDPNPAPLAPAESQSKARLKALNPRKGGAHSTPRVLSVPRLQVRGDLRARVPRLCLRLRPAVRPRADPRHGGAHARRTQLPASDSQQRRATHCS